MNKTDTADDKTNTADDKIDKNTTVTKRGRRALGWRIREPVSMPAGS